MLELADKNFFIKAEASFINKTMVLTNIHTGIISGEIKTIKKEVEILELKRRITEIKNSLGVLNRRLEMTKKYFKFF